jgi:hypothetical protein
MSKGADNGAVMAPVVRPFERADVADPCCYGRQVARTERPRRRQVASLSAPRSGWACGLGSEALHLIPPRYSKRWPQRLLLEGRRLKALDRR